MADSKKYWGQVFLNLSSAFTADAMQRLCLGLKDNGQPRSVVDVALEFYDHSHGNTGNRKGQPASNSALAFYMTSERSKKRDGKGKSGKKGNKYWHM